MSEVTKRAFYTLLSQDAALAGLLGTDEAGRPAIYNASYNQAAADHDSLASDAGFPCVTFREGSGSADLRFRSVDVSAESCEFEVWSRDSSAQTVPRICAAIDRLLHNQTIVLESGRCYDCVRTGQNPDLYDERLKLHAGLLRYRLVVRR